DASWHPAADAAEGTFNLLPMFVGTLLATGGAVLLATPLGVGSALFCRFYAPPLLARPYRMMIELLAGIPSVVYGFWGLVVLVPLIAAIAQPGSSLLAGILILSIMILPTVALVADASFSSVPRDYLRAAAALGLSRRGTITGVVLPTAASGLLTGVILAIMRALGETMAVLMVCGNVVQVPGSLFDPVRTLTANIALEMAYAMGDHRSALFVSGLLLMGLVTLLVAAAELVSRGRSFIRQA
ncbi:MAG: phosphate ABC transporter permease subunit PstC, partial [Maioricimonas sp. JB049]